jgi:Membrane bound O-acyl transferase family
MIGESAILAATPPWTLLYLGLFVIPQYISLYCVAVRAPLYITGPSTLAAVAAFATVSYAASTHCPLADIVIRLACGTAIMKVLDMFFRRNNPPKLKWPARSAVQAFYLLIELRYESFNISTVRDTPIAPDNELTEYTIHLAIFLGLQLLPQLPAVKALGLLFAIWLIWTLMHHIFKYRGRAPSFSPRPVFGPIYRAGNLCSFWKDTWHTIYTSPIRTLGYAPMRKVFGPIGGVLGAFALMAVFHVWAFAPYFRPEGLFRVAVFFMVNGVGCIFDNAIWGERITWLRVIVNWLYQLFWAQYTVRECDIPDGLLAIDFKNFCRRN